MLIKHVGSPVRCSVTQRCHSVVAGSAEMEAVGLLAVLGNHAGLWRQEEM